MSEVLGAFILWEQNRDVRIAITSGTQCIYASINRFVRRVDTENCRVFSCHIDPPIVLFGYFWGAISSSLVTLPAPATAVAAASALRFSSSVRTGPRRVTCPFCTTTLMLWA